MPSSSRSLGVSRRTFLRSTAVPLVGAGLATESRAASKPRVLSYRTLGRTDIKMSDISLGSSSLSDPDIVRYAYDRGVNYFDSAESYRFGSAEEAIGEALEKVRDKVYLTSKTKAYENDDAEEMMRSLEASLKRLRTDYIDVYFNHSVNDVDRMKNEAWWEFTEKAKRQGKIRYRGMSGHGSRLVPCLDYTIENGLADVVLVAYNFGQDPGFYEQVVRTFHFAALQPGLPKVIAKAHQRGIGVVAMKVLMGGRLNDLSNYEGKGATFAQAALTWVNDNPLVDGLVISMDTKAEIDEYLKASGQKFDAAAHLPLLEEHLIAQGAEYCQHGCDRCEGSCPRAVPIAEVLRTRMYAVDYGRGELARDDYAALGKPASACLDCTTNDCLAACPNGIAIPARMRATEQLLG